LNCRKCGTLLNEENISPSRKRKQDWICKKCNREATKNWRKRNPYRYYLIVKRSREKKKEYYKEWNRKWRSEHRKELNKSRNKWRRRKYIELINRLGNKCMKCEESRIEVLVVHHKFGRGNEHANKIIKKDYPIDNLLLLCSNCHTLFHKNTNKISWGIEE